MVKTTLVRPFDDQEKPAGDDSVQKPGSFTVNILDITKPQEPTKNNFILRRDPSVMKPPVFHYPIFSLVFSVVLLIFFGLTIWLSKGFESYTKNPFFGPTTNAMIQFGALEGIRFYSEHDYYRIVTSLVIHAGVIHLVLVIGTIISMGVGLEKKYAWWRLLIVFSLASISGNVSSLLLLPLQIQVGVGGGCTAILAIALIEALCEPKKRIGRIIGIIVEILIFVIAGLLPYLNNFNHLGGFISGIFLGLAFFPGFTMNLKMHLYIRQLIGGLCFVLFVGIQVVVLVRFGKPEEICPACTKMDCLKLLGDWCQ